MSNFFYNKIFSLDDKDIVYEKLEKFEGEEKKINNKIYYFFNSRILKDLSEIAFYKVSHFLRETHLKKLNKILKDREASDNDKYVALTLLKNANVAAGGILPMCQDTGTAIVFAKKGDKIITSGNDEKQISKGIFNCFKKNNLRYSQMAPNSMYDEKNTKNNLPAQIDIYSEGQDEYKFLFIAKGGGSANKTSLYQATPSLLRSKNIIEFLIPKINSLGTSACPPYHLAIVIGGLSAEMNLKALKLATAHSLDHLPTKGDYKGTALRDKTMERELFKIISNSKIGAQFGGKYFCHDVRVIRLPRHGASLPISIGVSCGADRQIFGKINKKGIFLEKLEENPAKYLPKVNLKKLKEKEIHINLNNPIKKTIETLSKLEVKSRVLLSGELIVARDMAHGKIKDKLDKGQEMPDYFKNYPIYYAGPAKTPKGYNTGSFGPTTAGRMDSYVEQFQKNGGSLIMLAKGNRSKIVKDSCKKYSGFYLGSIGGPGAEIAKNNIKSVKCIAYQELGMEAIWKIKVEKFPAFIVIDNKGNDFYERMINY